MTVQHMIPTYEIPIDFRPATPKPQWPPYPEGVMHASMAGQLWRVLWNQRMATDAEVEAFLGIVPLLSEINTLMQADAKATTLTARMAAQIKLRGVNDALKYLLRQLPQEARRVVPSLEPMRFSMTRHRKPGEDLAEYQSRLEEYEKACRENGLAPQWTD